MTRAEMLAELKAVLRETSFDAAWGDTRLLMYLSEGQDKFCEDTGFFIDQANYNVTTVVGTADYSLDGRIIRVIDVYDGTSRLGKFQQSDLVGDYRYMPTSFPSETSDSYLWQSDKTTGYLTLYPTPTTIRTLRLRVHRYSRTALNAATGEPEIPARFHQAPIHWAAFRAMTVHDMEQQDKVKAADHLAIYTQIKNEGRTAFERTMNREVIVSPNRTYVV
jgi:hypothetical protein